MKRFSSSDSFAALVSITSSKEEETHKPSQGYAREFQAMLDSLEEEDNTEEATHTLKKRRLTLDQVKALEKNFEVENKLEPERKQKLAEELGLQPRQVAIWFQNRRARWKTKQLEREYVALKANYEALKLNYDSLERQNESLTLQVKELKAKLREENADSSHSVKEEPPVSESENNISVHSQSHEFSDNNNSNPIIKDQSNGLSSHALMNWIQLSESRTILGNGFQVYQPHVKLEEQNVFSTVESCNFFSVDQAPILHWYYPEQ
ncbi:hypothetical protein P3X46_021282 [Hevea brasiliensis]|uniref:Homeobox-leucine zipper protein n=1 Tax=Hevea brasiliensis TaxID=3981 RepID=A0ABQ9LH43_HEVBR|nr:homeobox-leucine zipper protein ATHB-6 [Hevea brasiliensis]KAJ9166542.1 hypothetical protein P3X46_021282 [Hevea brasiliensis]